MHPDLTYAVARSHQHELRRHAEVGRRAAAFKTPKHRRAPEAPPRLAFDRWLAAFRTRLANA